MKSIENLLEFLNENWTYIVILVGALISGYMKYKKFKKMSEEEKKEAIKKEIDRVIKIISETMLGKVTDAEQLYIEYKKMGSVKRSKVISEIYKEYPILKEYVDQDYIIQKIDNIIDENLLNAKKTLEEIKKKAEENINTPVTISTVPKSWKISDKDLFDNNTLVLYEDANKTADEIPKG